jgi:flavorubredoxin
MARKTVIQIEREDAKRYLETLMSIRKRMIGAFERDESVDRSVKKWVNRHGPVLDELMEELGHRFRN